MPMRYTIDRDRRVVLSTASGALHYDEVREHQQQLLDDPNFDDQFDQLIDTTGVTSFHLSSEEVRVLASRRLFAQSSKRALVAATPAMYGIGRMMETYHHFLPDHPETGIFRTVEEAWAWLGKAAQPSSQTA